VDILTTNKH